MDNLHRKGWLDRERHGRAYLYWPTLTREQYSAGLMRAALDAGGRAEDVLARFIERMTPRNRSGCVRRCGSGREGSITPTPAASGVRSTREVCSGRRRRTGRGDRRRRDRVRARVDHHRCCGRCRRESCHARRCPGRHRRPRVGRWSPRPTVPRSREQRPERSQPRRSMWQPAGGREGDVAGVGRWWS